MQLGSEARQLVEHIHAAQQAAKSPEPAQAAA